MVDPAWTTTGAMSYPRSGHTMTTLTSGKILVAGASACEAELFDPSSGTFALTGCLVHPRTGHTASLLPTSGQVLLTGGANDLSAELYDPNSGTFAETGALTTYVPPRFTATVLASGEVLVAGGWVEGAGCYPPFYRGSFALHQAQIYDPVLGTFSNAPNMKVARAGHTATVLPDGKVLMAGTDFDGDCPQVPKPGNQAELFDPVLKTFSLTGALGTLRNGHTATPLPSGKVLVAGGSVSPGEGTHLTATELYDPATGTFAPAAPLIVARRAHTATRLLSGKVLFAGGECDGGDPRLTEIFDPGPGAVSFAGLLSTERRGAAAAMSLAGRVLISGPDTSADLFGGTKGDPCTTGAYCVSGFCADGRCCDAACDKGSCDRCDVPGKEGTCSLAPTGDPGNAPACSDSFACDGTSAVCPTSCASDAQCSASSFCGTDGTCKPRKANAAACGGAARSCKVAGCRECASGNCADDVCCDVACDGQCQACTAVLKQDQKDDGACGAARAGLDPRNDCAASGVLCGADGLCNGAGACRTAAPPGTRCAAGKVCDGSGRCERPAAATCDGDHTVTLADNTTKDCAPFKCDNNGECRETCTSVADCAAPSVCGADGKCTPTGATHDGGCTLTPARPASPSGVPILGLAVATFVLVGKRARRKRRRLPLRTMR
jgi:hypothetical protein